MTDTERVRATPTNNTPDQTAELRQQILKAGLVRKGLVTFSQKQYSNGSASPLETKSQDIIEIGIDDLMQLIATDRQKAVERAELAERIDEVERTRYDAANKSGMTTPEWNKFEKRLYDRLAELQAAQEGTE
jgi:hypothetical protein